ncbi:hypothetical protein BG015_010513 [Linnemannia schmuckeri]|uniref:F-box domain-containing protein n=1 Tax=Linnemannia schmuckeri TaxID=64567 RepID=A0A9P5RU08_9FUNG|nr:hypothetical protein BG015_010513 [Linnemannia schmuckeri]
MTAHPLELPEILIRIGHFIPLWVQIPRTADYRIQPKALVPSILVCMLWYNILSPLLWYFYDTELVSDDMPESTTAHFSPYISILRLKQLENLTLSYWDSVGSELGRVLQAIAGSLRKLQIGCVTGNEDDDYAYVTRDMVSIGGSSEDARQLAKDLCDFCPKDGGEASDLIVTACSVGNTLSRIKIKMSEIHVNTGSAISLHATTVVLSHILVETWNCRELEILKVDIPMLPDVIRYDSSGNEVEEEEKEEGYPTDCGLTSAQIVVLSGRVFTRSGDPSNALDPRIQARFLDEDDDASQRNPLDVSEILLRVGYHLPLWKLQNESPTVYTYAFHPQDLRSCLQVSKHWHQVLLPFLWELYIYPAMNNVPSSRINYIAHHIRTLRLQDDAFDPRFTGLEYVNQLKELDIPQQSWNQYEFENMFGVQLQKRLVRTNGEGLRALAWHGYGIAFQPAYFDMGDFVGFKQLRFLQLDKWFGGEGLLARVLDSVAGTVEVLQLYQILDVLPGAFNMDDHADDAMSLWTAMTSDEPKEPRRLRRLVMPKVVTLKFTVEKERNEGLVELVTCCPNLQRLSFTPSCEANTVRLAKDIEEFGLRNLQSLTVKNDEARGLDGVQCATLLQSSMEASKEPTTSIKSTTATRHGRRGLEKINIKPEALENEPRLVSRIVLHADTLWSLKLTLCGTSQIMSETFLPQILYQCHNLEVFSVKTEKIQFDLFEALGSSSGPWACRRLRKFIFSAAEFPIPELEKEEEDDEEGEGGAGALSVGRNWFRSWRNKMNTTTNRAMDTLTNVKSISSTHPVMGWYKHTSATTQLGRRSQAFETMLLRRAFRMLNSQNLKKLELLIWNGVPYERSKVSAVVPVVRIRLGDYHH